MPPDGSKLYLSELNRFRQPTGCEQSNGQRSFFRLQSPIAKLSDLFVRCQEICHRYVTITVIESWFSGATAISGRIYSALSIEESVTDEPFVELKRSELHPQRLRECGSLGTVGQPFATMEWKFKAILVRNRIGGNVSQICRDSAWRITTFSENQHCVASDKEGEPSVKAIRFFFPAKQQLRACAG